jgi:hypothetical protein
VVRRERGQQPLQDAVAGDGIEAREGVADVPKAGISCDGETRTRTGDTTISGSRGASGWLMKDLQITMVLMA